MNNDNSLSGVIVGALLVILVVGGAIWYHNDRKEDANGGALYVGITDATADIKNVEDISMEVKKVELHSKASGWTTVSSDSKKYDLLTLRNQAKTELYAKTNVAAGTYDRMRVTLGDTVVKTKANGSITAYSPSHQVVMDMAVKVVAGKDTRVKFDILADKSLHTTSDKKYVFAPVINAQSQSSTTVTLGEANSMATVGGSSDSSVSVGVDIDGLSRNNFILSTTNDLKVDSTILGSVKFMQGGKTYNENKEDQEESMNMNANINTDGSINNDDSLLKVDGSSSLDLNMAE